MIWKKTYFDTLESTNKTAEACPINTVVVAKTQTGGRGRYGKVWESPVGNLYVSLVLQDFKGRTPHLAFVVAVAVARALGDFNVRLKWPNDILIDGKKVAGILLERVDDKIIVGIGVNVVSNPTIGMIYETVSLEGKITTEETLNRILESLSGTLTQFEANGFEAIRTQWKEKAVGIGTQITVHLPNQCLTGIFKDLSESGALLLELPDKTITEITAGVVFLI